MLQQVYTSDYPHSNPIVSHKFIFIISFIFISRSKTAGNETIPRYLAPKIHKHVLRDGLDVGGLQEAFK